MPGEKFKEIHIKKETMRSYNDQFVGQIGNPSGGFDHKPEKEPAIIRGFVALQPANGSECIQHSFNRRSRGTGDSLMDFCSAKLMGALATSLATPEPEFMANHRGCG